MRANRKPARLERIRTNGIPTPTERVMTQRQASLEESAPAIPLQWRLTNPPAIFVGRDAEIAQLTRAIREAPASVVVGPGGSGKSALVLRTLFNVFPDRVSSTIRVGMNMGDSLAQLWYEVVRAASAAAGRGPIAWAQVGKTAQMLCTEALDIVEAHDLWVVLDDLHLGDPQAVDTFIRLLQAYGRRSRWIVTMRRPISLVETPQQVLALDALSTETLDELAQRCAPELPPQERRQAVQASEGSPWRLRLLLAGDHGAKELTGEELLSHLPADAADLVTALSVVQLPLPEETVAHFSSVPTEDRRLTLVQQGVLEPGSSRYALHDKTQAMVAKSLVGSAYEAVCAKVVAGLEADGRPEAMVESLRLKLDQENTEQSVSFLDEHGMTLVLRGFAPRMWRMLEDCAHPRLKGWRLRLGLYVASNDSIRWTMRQPEPEAYPDRLAWLIMRFLAGEVRSSLQSAKRLMVEADEAGDTKTTFDTGMFYARVCLQVGQPGEAAATLDALEPSAIGESVVRDACRSRVLALNGRYAEGLALARSVLEQREVCLPHVLIESASEVGSALTILGYLDEAAEAIEQATPYKGRESWAASTMQTQLRHLFLAIRTGRLDDARDILALLDLGEVGGPLLGVFVRILHAVCAALVGAFEGVDRKMDLTLSEAERSENAYMYQWSFFARTWLSLILNEDPLPFQWAPEIAPPEGPQRDALRLLAQIRANRYGVPTDEPWPERAADVVVELGVLRDIARAEEALIMDDPRRAIHHGQMAVARSREHGAKISEAEGLSVLATALICGEQWAALGEAAAALETLANEMPSLRFGHHARFFQMVASDTLPDAKLITSLSLTAHQAPALVDRIRALLGVTAPAHRLDDAIVAGLGRRWPDVVLRRFGAYREDDAACLWTVDLVRQAITLPDGRRVDLSKHALFRRLLTALAGDGGESDKATLAEEVWDVSAYHPLRDDKRIRVAVRRLRRLIEEDPSNPKRLVTIEDGYAIGITDPCIVLAAK